MFAKAIAPNSTYRALSAQINIASRDWPKDIVGVQAKFAHRTEIYGEGEPNDYLYKVVSGAICSYKLLNDGRRQVTSFYLPGDFFGLENSAVHALSAEAPVDLKVLLIRRSTIAALAERDKTAAYRLWKLSATELRRTQDHLMLLTKTARERVFGFLLDFAARESGATEVDLPMSRRDIADYLGLTIETVSRTISHLEHSGAISLTTSRHVALCSRRTLDNRTA